MTAPAVSMENVFAKSFGIAGESLMKNRARALATAGCLVLGLTGCSKSLPPVDVQFLASDLHYTIGGHRIVTPAVAIDRPDHSFDLSGRKPKQTLKDRLRPASNPHNPLRADKLALGIREYQYTGHHPDSRNICALLTRKWSQSVCLWTHTGLLRRLPERFELLDRNKLDLLKYHYTVGKERQYDHVKSMALRTGVTEIGCDKQSKFCTAVVEVLPGLLAVWTVWSNEQTGRSSVRATGEGIPRETGVTARAMADAQGAAIVQFVRRALGPVEDPTLVDAS